MKRIATNLVIAEIVGIERFLDICSGIGGNCAAAPSGRGRPRTHMSDAPPRRKARRGHILSTRYLEAKMPKELITSRTGYGVNFWRSCSRDTTACATCFSGDPDQAPAPRSAGRLYRSSHPLRGAWARSEALRYEHLAVKEGQTLRVLTNSMSEFWEDKRVLSLIHI